MFQLISRSDWKEIKTDVIIQKVVPKKETSKQLMIDNWLCWTQNTTSWAVYVLLLHKKAGEHTVGRTTTRRTSRRTRTRTRKEKKKDKKSQLKCRCVSDATFTLTTVVRPAFPDSFLDEHPMRQMADRAQAIIFCVFMDSPFVCSK